MSTATVTRPANREQKVRFRKTELVSYRTDDMWTAALSLAANRASKIAKLQDAGQTDRVESYTRSLQEDVAEFKRTYRGQHPDEATFFLNLDIAATPIPLAAPKTDLGRGDAVQLQNGLTARVSHDYVSPYGDVRMLAVRVTRTSSDPNNRHGARWEQQWNCRADAVTRISEDALLDHPED